MTVTIIGAGIGGLTAALALHQAGIRVQVFERARELAELGVGINLLPHATKELAALGLLPALDEAGIRTRDLIYATRFGQAVWHEHRGTWAGYEMPQFSIHRGKLHGVLARAVLERLGSEHVHTGCELVAFEERADHVTARLERRENRQPVEAVGDALIGCDGIHSVVRATLYPTEGPPVWSGIMMWRGAVPWPAFREGNTMVIAGGIRSRLVCYPILIDAARPDRRLTNWAVMARLDGAAGQPRREDWNRQGAPDEALSFVRDRFRLTEVDPVAMIQATGTIYEYPNCDRNPLPGWSFGRVTLLGDAAHPMYPVGSNGASQAILDASALARHLRSSASIVDALSAYDAERRPVTSEIVLSNRRGGPEGVIDVVEARAPEGCDDLEAVAPHAERQAIVGGYARLAGFSPEQVNRR
jgi:2-polyprenyl-6-methoxyphenol hydroxylase-like FAD-dependent oxidoreductase